MHATTSAQTGTEGAFRPNSMPGSVADPAPGRERGKGVPPPSVVVGLLSPREIDVAQAVAEGLTNKEVALRIGSTEATAKVHIKSILRKLNVKNRTQLAVFWQSGGTVTFATEQLSGNRIDFSDPARMKILRQLIDSGVELDIIRAALGNPHPDDLIAGLFRHIRELV